MPTGGATAPAGPRPFAAPELPGWTKTVSGGVTRYRAASVPAVLELTRPRPGVAPLALLTQQEGRASRQLAGYARVSLGPAAVASRPGAEWEYTWRAGGGPRHGLVRAVRAGPGTVTIRWYSVRAGDPFARSAFEQLSTLAVGLPR